MLGGNKMSELYSRINWNAAQLWRGCVLAGIAHAITVAKYPLTSNEHSWDGWNYSVQDSAGQRGTVSFKNGCCVAAFRNDNSDRIYKVLKAEQYFKGAPKEIIELANSEALQYLLDEIEGETRPYITTAFWGKEKLYSNDSFEEILINGGNLLEYHVLDIEMVIESWKERYDMDNGQICLLKSIYTRRVNDFNTFINLSQQEVNLLGTNDEEGLEESRISFEELRVYW